MGFWETRQAEMYQTGEMRVNQYFARLEKAFNQPSGSCRKPLKRFTSGMPKKMAFLMQRPRSAWIKKNWGN